MRHKIFKSDVEALIVEGRSIMDSTIDSRFYNRVAAVNAVLSGVMPGRAAVWFGMTGALAIRMGKEVDEHGFDALKDKPRPGAPARLTREQVDTLDLIIQGDPAEYGYRVWDGPTMSSLIEREFGVRLGTRQCQRFFHRMGYSKFRPQTYPSKDAERSAEREDFQKKDANWRTTRP